MTRLLSLVLCLFLPFSLAAQSDAQQEADKGFLTKLIEDNLSGATRDVLITGFEGALSSKATIALLTVSDADGVWLTLEGVTLDWNRSALLRGAIEIEELSADRIIVARAPLTEATAPSPEASPFALPELPVSITVGTMAIQELVLGEPFLGEEVLVSLNGSASLSGGEGTADVSATRLESKAGEFAIQGSYSNTTRVLGLSVKLAEDAGGLVVNALDLPGAPSLALTVKGTGPIDSYGADITLATDGEDRIAGRFDIDSDASGAVYVLDLDGDVSPLFAPEYQDFFGQDAELNAAVRTSATGEVSIEALELNADAITLTGGADIGASGWPNRLSLTGRIAHPTDDIVLLPIGGGKTYVDRITLDIAYDADVSDEWTAEFDIAGFDRPGLYLDQIQLAGGGLLQSGEGASVGQLTADFAYTANGLELDDAGLSEAMGDTLAGNFSAQRREGEPTNITRLTLNGPGIEVLADAVVKGPDGRFETQSNVLLTVEALRRFSSLAGRDLAGSGEIGITSTIVPLDGMFDVLLAGTTTDLSIGIPQLDATFAGKGTIAAAATRDEAGTRLSKLTIRTDQANFQAAAEITSNGSNANLTLDVEQAELIDPNLSGPMSLTAQVNQDIEKVVDIAASAIAVGLDAKVNAQMNPSPDGRTTNFDVALDAQKLDRLSDLIGRDIGGSAALTATGVLLADQVRFDVDFTSQTQDLRLGIAQLDPLLTGRGDIGGAVARLQSDLFKVTDLTILAPNLDLTIDGKGGLTGAGGLALRAEIPDAAVLGQGLSGPLRAAIDVTRGADEVAQVTLSATGPQTDVDVDATIAPPVQNYKVDGSIRAEVGQLSTYRRLIGTPVSGGIAVQASGSVLPDLTAFDGTVSAQTRNLGIGNATVDPLLAGAGTLDATASLQDGTLRVSNLVAATPNLSVRANLDGQGGGGTGEFTARLRDIGLLTDQLNGPVTAQGTASLNRAGNWAIDADASGPGGIGVQAQGTYNSNGVLDMDVDGVAPLGLANTVLAPRRLSGLATADLSIRGRPSLNAVSGRISVQDARLAAPTLGQALTDISGSILLNSGQGRVDLGANVEAGGRVTVTGPVALTGQNQANLTLRTQDIVLRDPQLYETTISGVVTANGPLQGGALISGQLSLGATEIQVPSSGIGALGDLPEVTHIGASPTVRRTIAKADAGPTPTSTAQSSGPVYPLDITINAPARIFIRGRGLDAELGGALRIRGTSANVVPTGLFELARGRIDILQQRFELTEGSASLQGDFVPVIRLVATTKTATGTIIRIIVEGPATEPEVRFESTPDLPQDEVLSQLIFGRDLASISPLQAVQLAAAVGTLAGRGGGGLVDTFRRDVGLDNLDITTDEDGNAAVRAGKYLTDNVYTDVTVSSDGSTDITINLDITDEITAKGSVGADGETAIGIFFERDY